MSKFTFRQTELGLGNAGAEEVSSVGIPFSWVEQLRDTERQICAAFKFSVGQRNGTLS